MTYQIPELRLEGDFNDEIQESFACVEGTYKDLNFRLMSPLDDLIWQKDGIDFEATPAPITEDENQWLTKYVADWFRAKLEAWDEEDLNYWSEELQKEQDYDRGIKLLNDLIKRDNIGGPWNFLQSHGREMRVSLNPSVYPHANRACFHNSYDLALEKGYTYCEGLALGVGSLPYHHAWCFDETTNSVVEATWPIPFEGVIPHYFGVMLNIDCVRQMRQQNQFSILDRNGRCPLNDIPVQDWSYRRIPLLRP